MPLYLFVIIPLIFGVRSQSQSSFQGQSQIVHQSQQGWILFSKISVRRPSFTYKLELKNQQKLYGNLQIYKPYNFAIKVRLYRDATGPTANITGIANFDNYIEQYTYKNNQLEINYTANETNTYYLKVIIALSVTYQNTSTYYRLNYKLLAMEASWENWQFYNYTNVRHHDYFYFFRRDDNKASVEEIKRFPAGAFPTYFVTIEKDVFLVKSSGDYVIYDENLHKIYYKPNQVRQYCLPQIKTYDTYPARRLRFIFKNEIKSLEQVTENKFEILYKKDRSLCDACKDYYEKFSQMYVCEVGGNNSYGSGNSTWLEMWKQSFDQIQINNSTSNSTQNSTNNSTQNSTNNSTNNPPQNFATTQNNSTPWRKNNSSQPDSSFKNSIIMTVTIVVSVIVIVIGGYCLIKKLKSWMNYSNTNPNFAQPQQNTSNPIPSHLSINQQKFQNQSTKGLQMAINQSIICAICLDSSCNYLLKCNHGFHYRCISEWMKRNRMCPLCRNIAQGVGVGHGSR